MDGNLNGSPKDRSKKKSERLGSKEGISSSVVTRRILGFLSRSPTTTASRRKDPLFRGRSTSSKETLPFRESRPSINNDTVSGPVGLTIFWKTL